MAPPTEESNNQHNNQHNQQQKGTALARFLNQLDLPTLLMVMLMGGGNFLVTKEDGRLTRDEAIRVSKEVHELYDALSRFETRQKSTAGNVSQTLENQAQQLKNQVQLLENQQRMLGQMRQWQQNYRNPTQ